MKKFNCILSALAAAAALAATLAFTACGDDNAEHSHVWSTAFTQDGDRHYQTCNGCDEKNYASHDFTDGDCVCGKVKPEATKGLAYRLSDDGTYYIASGKGTSTETDIVIANTYNDLPVTSIGDAAFLNCDGLTSVIIPDSVTSIGSYAFTGCSKLTSIQFKGTKAEWKAIAKNYNWNYDTGNFTVTCTDGTLDKNGNEIA